MCKFFSFLTDPSTKKVYFFDAETRLKLKKRNPLRYTYDSHSSIAEYFNVNEDRLNKYEYCPFRKKLILDKRNSLTSDLVFAKEFVKNYDFTPILDTGLFSINFSKLRTLVNEKLTFPKILHGDLNLFNLDTAKNLVLPEKITGNLNLYYLKSAEGITFPKEVGGTLTLHHLKSAKGVIFPEVIGGNLSLLRLESAEGAIFPKQIGHRLNLDGLKSTKGLILPKKVGHIDCPLLDENQ